MLDKSLPYFDIVMKADKITASKWAPLPLPDGYSFKMYEDGDEDGWAALEVLVGEFASHADALAYFQKVFLPHRHLLPERMCFVTDADEKIIATASAWFKEEDGRHYPLLHWISTSPEVQGKGIGSAVTAQALSVLRETDPGADVFLHTQTWSHRAIKMYYKYGFRITKTSIPGARTDFRYREVLHGILPDEILNGITA